LVPELAGSKIYSTAELIGSYLRATRRQRPQIEIWLPGKAASALRAGANLAAGGTVGQRSWEEFLAERVQVAKAVPPISPCV
jgi:hypothetical protein